MSPKSQSPYSEIYSIKTTKYTNQNLRTLVLKNALWNGGSRLVVILLNLVTVPVFIVKLGGSNYGVYVLILSLLSVMQLFCMGTGEATIKFMAESEGKGKRDDTERYFRNGLFCFISASLIGMITVMALSEFLIGKVLNIAAADQGVYRLSLLWFVFGWIFRNLNVGLWNIPIALQRYDIIVPIRDGEIIVERLLGLGVVLLGGGIVEIFQAQLFTLIVAIIISIWVVRRLMPGVVLIPALDWGTVRKMLRFGIWQSVASVGLNFRETVDRWIVGAILSPAVVGYYSAVLTVATSIQGFVTSFGGVLFPTFSHLHGQERSDTVSRIFVCASWALNLLGVMFCIPGIIFGRQFLTLWLGTEIPDWTYRLLVIVLTARIINSAGVLQPIFLVGIGKTIWNAFIGFSQLVFVAVINWILLALFGELGLGWANFSIGLVAWLVLVKMRRVFFHDLSIAEYYTGLFSIAACGLLFVPAFLVVFPQGWISHVDSWLELFLVGGVSALAVGAVIVVLSFFLPGREMRHQMMASTFNAVWSSGKHLFKLNG